MRLGAFVVVFVLLSAGEALDAGHESEVFVAGQAVYLMRNTVADAAPPVVMPAFNELIDEVVAQRVPIFV